LQNKERFEELVQRMRRIRQAKVQQRVGHQQVSEFVVHIGRGHRVMGQQSEPQRDRQQRQQEHAPAGFPGKPARGRNNPGREIIAIRTSRAASVSSRRSLGPKMNTEGLFSQRR